MSSSGAVQQQQQPATSKDVEMTESAKAEPTPQEIAALIIADVKKNLALLEKSVATKESRLISRALRALSLRKKLTAEILRDLINQTFVEEETVPQKQLLLGYLDKVKQSSSSATSMETEPTTASAASGTSTSTTPAKEKKPKALIPEVEAFIHLLVTIFLLDSKHYEEACSCSGALVDRIQSFNRRTLNPLSAKAYFYYARSYELTHRLEDIRVNLLNAYRTATLRHNEDAQAVLVNAILRNYLEYNLYDQADKFVSNITFKEESTPSNQYARYLYYQGKIKSTQLAYTEAYKCLLGAIRKAPQSSARGFRITVHKLTCIVQLLMGEIPERSIFRQTGLKQALVPYLQLTKAVRVGDLDAFNSVVKTYKDLFVKDKTFTLIQRLHHNVIKTGLRKINLAYTRISFEDICAKLHLDSIDDAEFIVAKAIRDGVINATINHEGKYIQSKENLDIYSTQEPQEAFHKRIKFCLKTHNDAVKAMRFPPDANKASVETAKERREREQEIAKNLAEEEEEEF